MHQTKSGHVRDEVKIEGTHYIYFFYELAYIKLTINERYNMLQIT